MWVAGVDGCRAGWIAAFAEPDRPAPPRLRVVRTILDVIDAPERPAMAAIDIPIGLPERSTGSGRRPDQLVRSLLGGRQSAVFAIPSRQAVYAADYAEACRMAFETSDPPRKVSKQAFMIFPKIREVDTLLLGRPDLASRLHEMHPEVAFWSLNGEKALDEPKTIKGRPYEPGLSVRRRLLILAGLDPGTVEGPPPAGAAADDLLDALAGLAVALKIAEGLGRSFPDPPDRDALGLPVAIWTFRT